MSVCPAVCPAVCLAVCGAFGGCAGSRGPSASIDERVEFVDAPVIEVRAGAYAATFERARDALRDAGFTLDRVDAAAGVISTEPLPGIAAWKSGLLRDAGLAGFGDWHATTVEARAVFTPGEPTTDVRTAEGTIALRFEVVERREHRPSRRIDTTSVIYGSEFSDRTRARQGLEPGFTVAAERSHRAEVLLGQRVMGYPPQ